MDVNRVAELEELILAGVRAQTPRICSFEPLAHLTRGGRVLSLGRYRCIITLRPVGTGTGRHSLRIASESTRPKVFRETRSGWFPIQHVVSHVVSAAATEAAERRQSSQKRQRLAMAAYAIIRLSQTPGGESKQLELLPSADQPGAIDVVVRGLQEAVARKLIVTLEELRIVAPKASPRKDLWAHLRGG